MSCGQLESYTFPIMAETFCSQFSMATLTMRGTHLLVFCIQWTELLQDILTSSQLLKVWKIMYCARQFWCAMHKSPMFVHSNSNDECQLCESSNSNNDDLLTAFTNAFCLLSVHELLTVMWVSYSLDPQTTNLLEYSIKL